MIKKSLILLFVVLSLPAQSIAQEELEVDVKSGVFAGQIEAEPEKRRSRYEDVRQERAKRENRNPRDNVVRQVVDTTLDFTINGTTASDVKHGLDTVQNINEAMKIKNKRLKTKPSSRGRNTSSSSSLSEEDSFAWEFVESAE